MTCGNNTTAKGGTRRLLWRPTLGRRVRARPCSICASMHARVPCPACVVALVDGALRPQPRTATHALAPDECLQAWKHALAGAHAHATRAYTLTYTHQQLDAYMHALSPHPQLECVRACAHFAHTDKVPGRSSSATRVHADPDASTRSKAVRLCANQLTLLSPELAQAIQVCVLGGLRACACACVYVCVCVHTCVYYTQAEQVAIGGVRAVACGVTRTWQMLCCWVCARDGVRVWC